jgi:hypothetical protein
VEKTMKNQALVLSLLLLAADFAGATGRCANARTSGQHGFSSRGSSSRRFSRSAFAGGVSSRTGFAGSALKNGRATFGNAKLTGGTGGTGSSAPTISPSAAVGAKVLTLGQAPVYSNPGGGGTTSVQGGGFVAIDPSHATDALRGPGITWGAPDKASSSGGGGSGASSNGPAFDPSF